MSAPWLNLVWYDPSVPTAAPSSLPTLHHFDDLDIVAARSDWSGNESLVVLKCGPFLGHKAVQEFSYDPGGGHVHPDANHFVLFGAGGWLIRDDGYRSKWTGQHNTLLIDGRGQLGEGQQWFQGSQPLAVKARPRILRADSTPTLDHIVGDATEAYPAELGVERFQRHLLFLKPDVLVVADDIRLKKPKELELRFHPEEQSMRRDGEAFVFAGKSVTLRCEPLNDGAVRVDAVPLAAQGRHGEEGQSLFAVRLVRTAALWRSVVAMSWAAAGQPVQNVVLESQGEVAVCRSGNQTISLNWSNGELTDTKRLNAHPEVPR